MTFFQKCLGLNKIIILTPSGQKKPIFSKGQCRMSNFFLSVFLPMKSDQNIKKLETSFSRGFEIDVAQLASFLLPNPILTTQPM